MKIDRHATRGLVAGVSIAPSLDADWTPNANWQPAGAMAFATTRAFGSTEPYIRRPTEDPPS